MIVLCVNKIIGRVLRGIGYTIVWNKARETIVSHRHVVETRELTACCIYSGDSDVMSLQAF